MSYRDVRFAPHEFYHIYNRGNSKRDIFLDTADYKRFQDLLYLANARSPVTVRNARRIGIYEVERGDPIVAVGAYCLLPNHFHLLLTPLVDDGISAFVQKISTGYAMYFNKRYQRTGGLFEGKFKSKYATHDEYLKYLFSYIHLNPLRLKYHDWKERVTNQNRLLLQAREYPFSSYQDYVHDMRNESLILNKDLFPEYFTSPDSWNREMKEWITLEYK